MKPVLIVLNSVLLALGYLLVFGFLADTSPREQNQALVCAVAVLAGAAANLGLTIAPRTWSRRTKWPLIVTGVTCLVIAGLPALVFLSRPPTPIGACEAVVVDLILLISVAFGWTRRLRKAD
jgi:hypothetical protein